YPNKTYACKLLDHEKYALDYVGKEMLNPFADRYASYPLEKDGVTHKIQFVPRNADGSFNFIKDQDAHCHPPINDRSIANASCTAIGPPPLKSRPSLQAQVSKTMKIRVPDRG
ncbi:hypothetical protein TNCV_581781, partial [Trichonephila clavipes]